MFFYQPFWWLREERWGEASVPHDDKLGGCFFSGALVVLVGVKLLIRGGSRWCLDVVGCPLRLACMGSGQQRDVIASGE